MSLELVSDSWTEDEAYVTVAQTEAAAGEKTSMSAATQLIYDELKRIARYRLNTLEERVTLDPSDLVHDAFVRIHEQRLTEWESPARLLGVAAIMVRRVLMNHLRARGALKRGGGRKCRIAIDTDRESHFPAGVDLLDLDQALTKLETLESRQVAIVEMRFFGGMTVPQVASALEVSHRTIEADWAHAKLWLARELRRA